MADRSRGWGSERVRESRWTAFDDRHLNDRARIHNDLHAAGIQHLHNRAGHILIAPDYGAPYYNSVIDYSTTPHLAAYYRFGSAEHDHTTD